MKIIFFIILAVLPSILWLLFFLRRDKHPEPNKMVFKVFSWGILATFAVLLAEILYAEILSWLSLVGITALLFLGNAFIEEYFKYLVIKLKVLKSVEFDEPVDALIYMIIAALGFATAENVFLVNSLLLWGMPLEKIFAVILIRFLGAVLIHVFASSLVGYWLARSFSSPSNQAKKRSRRWLVAQGLILATGLHGIYNYIIIRSDGSNSLYFIILASLFILSSVGLGMAFKQLRGLKSICKN